VLRADRAAATVVLSDPELRPRLGQAGIETATDYAWEQRIDALETFVQQVAAARVPRRFS